MRRLGLDIDIVSPDADLKGYRLIVAPSLPILRAETQAALEASGAIVLFGPRTGSRTVDGHIPDDLPPGPLASRLPFRVARVESLRPGAEPAVIHGHARLSGRLWREHLETDLPPRARFDDGAPAWVAHMGWHYLATWPEPALFDVIATAVAAEAGLTPAPLPPAVRIRSRDGVRFAFNYAADSRPTPAPPNADYVLGGPELGAAGVAAWRL